MHALDHPFDDLRPGTTFRTRGRTVTEADVVAFAGLTGDFHPQHTDAAFAATSAFGGRIAHGMLVASYAVGLVPFDPGRVIALRGVRHLVFKRPVRPGDTIHVVGTVDRLRAVDAATGLVATRWRVCNQRTDLVALLTVDALWRREPATPEPELVAPVDPGFVPIPL